MVAMIISGTWATLGLADRAQRFIMITVVPTTPLTELMLAAQMW